MKTDLTTPGSFSQSKALNAFKEKGTVAKKPPILPQTGKPASPDYKLDLSSKLSSPDLPTPSAPSAPSLPSSTSSSKPDLSVKDVVKEEAKTEVKDKAKEEIKSAEAAKVEEKEGTQKRPAIIFIKGMDVFSSPSTSESGYAGVGRIADSIKGSRIYGWDQKDEIIKEIKKVEVHQPVVLVGHSFGGDTAVDVANTLDSLEHQFRPVDLLVTIDAVGFNNDIIPQNVKEHLNVFGERDYLLNDGPHVGRRHEKTSVTNILSPLRHTEIDDDKEVQYEIVNLVQRALNRV